MREKPSAVVDYPNRIFGGLFTNYNEVDSPIQIDHFSYIKLKLFLMSTRRIM